MICASWLLRQSWCRSLGTLISYYLVVLVSVTHDHDIVTTSEGVSVDLAGIEIGVRVTSLSLEY